MLQTLHGLTAHVVPADHPVIDCEQAALDLIGELYGVDVDLVVVPADRLSDDFYRLRTGLAGAVVQKFVFYFRQVAIVGDISGHLEASSALRDFVRESNARSTVWFAEDHEALESRLAGVR